MTSEELQRLFIRNNLTNAKIAIEKTQHGLDSGLDYDQLMMYLEHAEQVITTQRNSLQLLMPEGP